MGTIGGVQRDQTGEIAQGGTLPIEDLRTGDCFNDPDDPDALAEGLEVFEVEVVPCREAHDNEMYARGLIFEPSTASYPGGDELFEQAYIGCLEEFVEFVGIPWEDSLLDITVITPTPDSWVAGDRAYRCAVFDYEGPVEGSLKGASR